MFDFKEVVIEYMVIDDLKEKKETVWQNEDMIPISPHFLLNGQKFIHIKAAQNRLMRFMPYIEATFPETADRKGIIESNLLDFDNIKDFLVSNNIDIPGRILLKDDAHLPISGSIKARGGIYEVLKFAEDVAIKELDFSPSSNHAILASEEYRKCFGKYTIQVGSTGNLGLSIGIISAKLGFKVKVHMSIDAKQWKKDLLREIGADVIEYESDYSEALKQGRILSDKDPYSYFVDDEASKDLFMGYATAALRLRMQLRKKGVEVDENHPLFVYIPCGVGGAPSGLTFGLKQLMGEDVHCFFVEPTNAPCVTLGMASGKGNKISVSDIGLSGKTIADGLAVGRMSGFAFDMMKPLLDGCMTVEDEKLLVFQKNIMMLANIYLEPSACAGLQGLFRQGELLINKNYKKENITHIIWATGGGLEENVL